MYDRVGPALGLHDVGQDVRRGSASRPSACRSCRRCTAARRHRAESIATRGSSAGATGASRSASVWVPSTRGAPAPAAEYSASDVTMICSMRSPALRTESTSGASASSVITSADAGVGGDRQHLARGVARVDVDDDRAEPQHGERGEDVLRAVGQHDADAVALGDAECARARRRARRPAASARGRSAARRETASPADPAARSR